MQECFGELTNIKHFSGKPWKEPGGMHLPAPNSANGFTSPRRWFGSTSFHGHAVELQLDLIRGADGINDAILFVRFPSIDHGPKNQATACLRARNCSADGTAFIRYAGNMTRRANIRGEISVMRLNGKPVRTSMNRIILPNISSPSFRTAVLTVCFRIAIAVAPVVKGRLKSPVILKTSN